MLAPLLAMMPLDNWVLLLSVCAAIAVTGALIVRKIRADTPEQSAVRRGLPLSLIAVVVALIFGLFVGVAEALASHEQPKPWELFWGRVLYSSLVGVFVGFILALIIDWPRCLTRPRRSENT